MKGFRLIPLVLVAVIGLAGLKISGLVLKGGYIFEGNSAPLGVPSRPAWARDMFSFSKVASRTVPDLGEVTGSVEGKKSEEKKDSAKSEAKSEKSEKTVPQVEGKQGEDKAVGDADAKPKPGPFDPVVVVPDQNRQIPASERAILERLQERRQELEARAREIDIRENLLKSAEKRIEGKVEEVKATEARVGMASEQKNQADTARFKGIVTMYEGMKPKDAAKIFDRLDMSVLIEVASQIAPRKMSEILGVMQPEAAERLTVEMAHRAGGDRAMMSASDLPKIEGRTAVDGNN
jgi:flagellar motility protein MotE (MotC chaperone)